MKFIDEELLTFKLDNLENSFHKEKCEKMKSLIHNNFISNTSPYKFDIDYDQYELYGVWPYEWEENYKNPSYCADRCQDILISWIWGIIDWNPPEIVDKIKYYSQYYNINKFDELLESYNNLDSFEKEYYKHSETRIKLIIDIMNEQ